MLSTRPSSPIAAIRRTSKGEKLGRVLFKTSCTPEAQKQFERALAMLHSFFFPETVKAFNAIPEDRSGLRHRLLGHRRQRCAPTRWSARGMPPR